MELLLIKKEVQVLDVIELQSVGKDIIKLKEKLFYKQGEAENL